MTMNHVIYIVLVCVLVLIVVDDIRNYQIKNSAVITLFFITIFQFSINADFSQFVAHVVFSAIAFGMLLFAFRRKSLGGGDVKLLTIAFLAVGPEWALLYAIFLLVLSVVYWIGAKLDFLPSQRVGGQMKVPFGPSIAGAWIATIAAIAAQLHV